MIGPHVILYTPGAQKWAQRASIVKVLDNPAPLRDADITAVRVFRAYVGDGFQPVDTVFTAVVNRLAGYNHSKLYVEGINEPAATDERARQFYEAYVPRMHQLGYRVCGPCWSTGNPEQDVWNSWRAAGWYGLDAIAVHCYWGAQGFTPWNALRPFRFWDSVHDPPLLITECGRDAVEGMEGKPGWKLQTTAAEYALELIAFDQIISQRGAMGATPFTAGPGFQWANFDTDPLVDLILPTQSIPVKIPPVDPTPPGGSMDQEQLAAIMDTLAQHGTQIDILARALATFSTAPDLATLENYFGAIAGTLNPSYAPTGPVGAATPSAPEQPSNPSPGPIQTRYGACTEPANRAIQSQWPKELWTAAAEVAYLESHWVPTALDDTTSRGPCGTYYDLTLADGTVIKAQTEVSKGLFQLNTCVHAEPRPDAFLDPVINARAAYALYQGQGWQPWYLDQQKLGL